ncbi:hypothetical protein HDF16_001381 [Granulicella aggregans]|uniref:DUF91 domain-containing protein n=1 Tax=Granulicella aggregans TaxID=474949 RepID=A0A7W7ZC74_9BACT|nr:hypothetical protein [Granulicella aggregans]MBB5056696.1 hypothetical protein [Granulicella aggregans]
MNAGAEISPGQKEQTARQVAGALEAFLAEHPAAVLLEDGRPLFDMRTAKYTVGSEHGRCSLHMWDEERNLVRRVVDAAPRKASLRLSTMRFGQTKPQMLELVADKDRRTPSTRESTRLRYMRRLEKALLREFPDWNPDGFRTSMDLEKSFGPAYARGVQVKGTQAWAVIGVNKEETQATVDGVMTPGILWLAQCREGAGGRRLFQGLRVIVPKAMEALTLSRLAWLNPAVAKWELYVFDEEADELASREAGDFGNLVTRLLHAPNEESALERFGDAAKKVLGLVPQGMRGVVEMRVRSGGEMAFLIHGLEFARARMGYAGQGFNRVEEITFGAGANETPLTEENETELRELVERLFARRSAMGSTRDVLYRMAPERWLESVLRRNVEPIDAGLDPAHVYTQVPAFAAADRGMLDLLGVTADGRLAVIELKAEEDLHLALQGLDYWVRVRAHHLENPDPVTGLGEFQRNGYFGGVRLAASAPRLFLVAPALRIHPATETVLRYFSPRVEWTLVAIDERWRQEIKVVWKKRSSDGARGVYGGEV